MTDEPHIVAADDARWQRLESVKVFEARDEHTVYMEVFQDKVKTSSGKVISYARYYSSDVVLVVPFLDDGRLVMIKQYRYPLDKFMLEFPAGHVEEGEQPLFTARRELEEETGYRAEEIKCIYKYHPSVSKSRQLVHVFQATGLVPGATRMDGTESITTKIVTISELRQLIQENKIENAGTLISFLLCCTGLEFPNEEK